MDYTFASVELKEFSFRIDGVFLPPTSGGSIFFLEVQMKLDSALHERMLNEISTYIRQNPGTFKGWQAIIIYPDRATEQKETEVPEELFASGRFLPIYLNELFTTNDLPLGPALMLLTLGEDDKKAISSAKGLINQQRHQVNGDAIIDLVTEIMVYRFSQLSREDIEAMLDITLQETRVYKEVKAEGRNEGLAEGLTEGRFQERQEGTLLMLQIKFNKLPTKLKNRVSSLSFEQLQELQKMALTLSSIDEL